MSFSLFAELMPEMQAAVHQACDPLSFMLMGMTCQAAAARLLARPQPHAFLGTHMVEEGAPISVVRWFAWYYLSPTSPARLRRLRMHDLFELALRRDQPFLAWVLLLVTRHSPQMAWEAPNPYPCYSCIYALGEGLDRHFGCAPLLPYVLALYHAQWRPTLLEDDGFLRLGPRLSDEAIMRQVRDRPLRPDWQALQPWVAPRGIPSVCNVPRCQAPEARVWRDGLRCRHGHCLRMYCVQHIQTALDCNGFCLVSHSTLRSEHGTHPRGSGPLESGTGGEKRATRL